MSEPIWMVGEWCLRFLVIGGIIFLFGFGLLGLFRQPARRQMVGFWTIAAALIAINISTVAPLSGMSRNPARSAASAVVADAWKGLWIYFTAPPIGMLLAAEIHTRLKGARSVACAKLHHHNNQRCIFNCNFKEIANHE